MAHISFSPRFLKDSLLVFKQRGIKGLLLGTTASQTDSEAKLIKAIENNYAGFQKLGARLGNLHKLDTIHKGRGPVYLVANPAQVDGSAIVFGVQTKIANGPDLWLYLSKSDNPRNSFGKYLNLGLLKGNKGGQVYYVDAPLAKLADYKSAIIYCKQFDVLFSYALLK